MSRYAYNGKDPAAYTVWWAHQDGDVDMDCGSFPTRGEAEAALSAIAAELLTECAQDAERVASIQAGSLYLEYPEDDNGERGRTEPLDWPAIAPLAEMETYR